MKIPPYDTGKVKIGCRYDPPIRCHMSRDAELIQAAFLRGRRPKPKLTFVYFYLLVVVCILALWVVSV